jgi:hypothetical protein
MFTSLFLSRHLRLLEHPIVRPLIILASYAVLVSPVSEYPYENIAFAMKLGFLALVFACTFHIAERGLCREKLLAASAWAVLGFMTVSQIIGLLTGNTARMYASDYATAGLMGQPAIASAVIISSLPVFLRYFPGKQCSAGIMITLVCLSSTMRRTAIISAACAIVVVLIYNLHPFRRGIPLRKVIGPLLILVVLAIGGLRTQAGSDLLTRMADLDPREGSGSGRYVFWLISLDHMARRGVFAQITGEGMGTIRDVIGREFALAVGSHNAWLDLTHAFGAFGLAAIVWWYLGLVRFAVYLRKLRQSRVQGVLAVIVILFLESIGQGGFADPSFALVYAALGFWAGQAAYYGRPVQYAKCTSNRRM